MPNIKAAPYLRLLIPALLLLALLTGLVFMLGRRGAQPESESPDTAAGIAYLQSLEAQAPTVVEERLKELRLQELQAMHDQRLKQLESGELSVWSLFEDYVVLGDSRSCGFFFGSFLPRERVLADYGNTVEAVEKYLDDVVQINPSYIFLCYGLNDIVQPDWDTPEKYAAGYLEYIKMLQEQLPDAKIYVNSIFPCYDPAFNRWEKWREAPQYSAALGEMVESTPGCYFIANENIDDSFESYYQDDGIHFTAPFYPVWATNMIMEVYDSELNYDEAPAA